MSDLPRRLGYTVMFLRMTAKEMLELAERTPVLAETRSDRRCWLSEPVGLSPVIMLP